ncbi:phosphoenolpyruvate carboxylase [Helicobacter baculiformis]|uniref:Phosphoenolpyruvate carboxylase n=1 Tax=Helicobacter baculiformis TaxID=427351 RepID=A0ABV7ZF88_9HELI|nr:phosphoenolpyruvate carboxylase [Helicobacter baculiformis]
MRQDLQVRQELEFLHNMVVSILEEFSPATTHHFLRLKALFEHNTPEHEVEIATALREIAPSAQILEVIKAFSLYNILINIVEERYKNQQPSLLDQAYQSLLEQGFESHTLDRMLEHIQFYPVFTAHPTESMRRTFLEATQEIYADLCLIFDHSCNQATAARAKEHLAYRLRLLWKSHLIRQERLEVLFELDNLLYILEHSILPSAQELLGVIQQTLKIPLKQSTLQLGSWIGGDRDGNPFVSNTLMHQVVVIQHEFILKAYLKHTAKLQRELSLASDFCSVSRALQEDLRAHFARLDPTSARLHAKEPFRAKLVLMEQKLKNRLIALNAPLKVDFAYQDPQELLADIDLLLENLEPSLAQPLLDFRHLVLLAGFHLLRLDFREHRDVFLYAISEVFCHLGLATSDFYALEESAKLEILNHALAQPPTPLSSLELSPECKRLLEAFNHIVWAKHKVGAPIFHSIIISMTTQASDLLSVLWLAKQHALTHGHPFQIYITPLFETIHDLQHAQTIMRTLSQNPHYRAYLESMHWQQEIMVGYSDSSKDGGIFASNYNLHGAISALMDLGKELGIGFILFHGRGGSVSRGGGNLQHALLNAPLHSVNRVLKLTEQGETISSKYLNPSSALSNFSNITGALLTKVILDRHCPLKAIPSEAMQIISEVSCEIYRDLIYATPDFLDYFKHATPIAFIQELNLGSRPSKRKESTRIEDLRAIPWVFAWTQNRSILPAWYGVGSGLESVGDLEKLRDLYCQDGFFKVVLDNIAQVLLKVDLQIAHQYHHFATHSPSASRIWVRIEEEFSKTMRMVLAVRTETHLLEKDSDVREGILFRTPYINALNCLQIALISEFNTAHSIERQAQLKTYIHSTIIGIAQGMRNTG